MNTIVRVSLCIPSCSGSINRIGLFFWVLTGLFPLYAQQHSFQNFTTFDGLTSNETYHLLQDEQQRLLITSDHGLMRYDGQRFEQVPFEDPELNGSTVFELRRGPSGRIWLSSYLNGLFFLENDTLRPHPHNKQVLDLIIPRYIVDFQLTENGSIWFVLNTHLNSEYDSMLWYELDSAGTLHEHPINPYHEGAYITHAVRIFPSGQALALRNKTFAYNRFLKSQTPKGDPPVLAHTPYGFLLQEERLKRIESYHRNGPAMHTEGGHWIASDTLLYFFSTSDEPVRTFRFSHSIQDLYLDQQRAMWICTRDGAYRLMHPTQKPEPYLPGHSISDVHQDHEGGYWFSSTDQGLFYLPLLAFHTLDPALFSGEVITALAANTNQLAVAYGLFQGVHLFDVNTDSVRWSRKHPTESDSKEIWLSPGTLYHNRGFFDLGNADTLLPFMSMILDIEVIRDSLILIGGRNSFQVIMRTGGLFEEVSPPKPQKTHFVGAVHWANGTIYAGTNHGVMRTYLGTWELEPAFPALPQVRISDLASFSDSILVVATRANGMYLVNLFTGEVVLHLDESSGLSSPFCSHIQIENDSVLWVGSNRGLNRIVLHRTGPQVYTFFASDGLVSDKINDLAWSNGWLFAASEHGVSYFRPQQMDYHDLKIEPCLHSIIANDSTFPIESHVTLQPGNRYLRLEYGVLTFRKKQSLKYAYRLRELDTNWTRTEETHASFGLLPPGNYTFDLKAWYGVGTNTFGLNTYTFVVPPYFYQRPWFRVSVIVLVFLVLLGGLFLYFRQRERQRQRDWDTSMAELKALSLQMNPHFLFNALNTIQYLSYASTHEVLSRFVQDLSKLTRNILENSRQLLIPLEMELKNTEYYLKLEQLRFEEKGFTYVLEVESGLDPRQVFLPPLLLQPIVENSLWHGLYPKASEDRHIDIRCARTDLGFEVYVEDNGIGRSLDPELNEREKTSIGLDNTRSRMALYQQMGLGTARVRIIDLKTPEGVPCGTRVTFLFVPHTEKR